MPDHLLIDQRSLALGRAVAALLQSHPEHIDRARENLGRWLKTCTARSRPALEEWAAALDGPLEGILKLLTSDEEHATRLRQSNPFAGVLPQGGRNSLLLQFAAHDAPRT